MKKVLPRFAPIPVQVVQAAIVDEPVKVEEPAVLTAHAPTPLIINTAADILTGNHEAHSQFVVWLSGKPATKRKAREFCNLMGMKRVA
jgi:hypothetical protein